MPRMPDRSLLEGLAGPSSCTTIIGVLDTSQEGLELLRQRYIDEWSLLLSDLSTRRTIFMADIIQSSNQEGRLPWYKYLFRCCLCEKRIMINTEYYPLGKLILCMDCYEQNNTVAV